MRSLHLLTVSCWLLSKDDADCAVLPLAPCDRLFTHLSELILRVSREEGGLVIAQAVACTCAGIAASQPAVACTCSTRLFAASSCICPSQLILTCVLLTADEAAYVKDKDKLDRQIGLAGLLSALGIKYSKLHNAGMSQALDVLQMLL